MRECSYRAGSFCAMWDALSVSLLQNAAFLSQNGEICEESNEGEVGDRSVTDLN